MFSGAPQPRGMNLPGTERFDLTVDTFNSTDIVLDGRIDLPDNPNGAPVLFIQEGSGPADADFSFLIALSTHLPSERCKTFGDVVGGQCRVRFDKYVSQRKIVPRGMAVVRIGKRGVRMDERDQPLPIDVDQHKTSTLSNRLGDLEKLVAFIRQKYPQLNTRAIFLWGVSEGSIVSTMYATAHPANVAGMILIGAVLDDLRWINHFQNVDAIWNQLLKVADLDHDGKISHAEFIPENLTKKPDPINWIAPTFAEALDNLKFLKVDPTFDFFDLNKNGFIEESEFREQLEMYYWRPKVSAVDANDLAAFALLPDSVDFSLIQYRQYFSYGRNGDFILQLKMPIAIFIGNRDLNCPAVQFDWFNPLIQQFGKTNITTHIENDYHYGNQLATAAIAKMMALGWTR
jgi:pimeloyl-ACP methyl ester carboxylesterase